jgi:hypothetical protein
MTTGNGSVRFNPQFYTSGKASAAGELGRATLWLCQNSY